MVRFAGFALSLTAWFMSELELEKLKSALSRRVYYISMYSVFCIHTVVL